MVHERPAHTVIHKVSTPPPWYPEPDTITLEAFRVNRDIPGFVDAYFEHHPGAITHPSRAALSISQEYGVDACEALLVIYRILERGNG